jgi:uncharacterized protein YndB with AHSA1/START domain
MTRISTSAIIQAPPQRGFDYVTTPAWWPRWHPSSLAVSPGVEHSLVLGEEMTEDFRVSGRRGRVVWRVTEREAPRRWVIAGTIEGAGNGGTVTYDLALAGAGTAFTRTFAYAVPTPLLRALDLLLIRWRVRAESAPAVRRLRAVLEGQAGGA